MRGSRGDCKPGLKYVESKAEKETWREKWGAE